MKSMPEPAEGKENDDGVAVVQADDKVTITEQKVDASSLLGLQTPAPKRTLPNVAPIPPDQQKLLQMCYAILKGASTGTRIDPKMTEATLNACRKLRVQDTHELLKFIVPRTFLVHHQLTRKILDLNLQQKQNNVDILNKQVEADRASPAEKKTAELKLRTAEKVLTQYYTRYHEAVESAQRTQRDDLDLAWRLLSSLIETSASEKGKADASRCMVNVAERTKDIQKLREAMDLYMNFAKTEFQDVIKQFMLLPLLGAWQSQTQLVPNLVDSSLKTRRNQNIKAIKTIEDQIVKLNARKKQLATDLTEVSAKLDDPSSIKYDGELAGIVKQMASTAEQSDKVLNYEILYDLMKLEGLHSSDMETDSMDWQEMKPKVLKIKFKAVAIEGFPGKEQQQRDEIESSGKGSKEWDILPNPEGFIIKRMGAVVQVVNITENFNLVGVDIAGRRIHCKGVTRDILEKESHAKKVKDAKTSGAAPQKEGPMFTPVKVGNQQVLMFDPKQAHVVKIYEEWDITVDEAKPVIWRGILTHISEPQLPKDVTKRNEDSAIVKTVFDFEMELEKPFTQRPTTKAAAVVKSGIDNLTLD